MDALHEIPPDKHIELDDKCIGCVLCREACPYDAIKMETTLSEPVRENVPNINPKLCRRCGACVAACRTGAIQLVSSGGEEAHSVIDEDKCVRCGYCSRVCPTEAIKYGEILPRSVVGGKAILVNQKNCIGCMTCTRVCPSRGAINVGKVSKLPFINPAYCARCEECMNVCPSAAIRYSSRKRAYKEFNKIKTREIVSELLEKETGKLSREAAKIDGVLNRIARDVSFKHEEEEFQEDVTSIVMEELEQMVDMSMKIEDIEDVVAGTTPKRDIMVVEENCIGCGACINECPVNCIELELPSPIHIGEECVYCGKCTEACQFKAIKLQEEFFDTVDDKILFIRHIIHGKRSGKLVYDKDACQACGICTNKCPVDALKLENNEIIVDEDKCILCGECELICPLNAFKLK